MRYQTFLDQHTQMAEVAAGRRKPSMLQGKGTTLTATAQGTLGDATQKKLTETKE